MQRHRIVIGTIFRRFAAACGLGSATLAGSAPSTEPARFDVREFVCPLGDAKFSQDVGYLSMPLVQFPDGSWLGDIGIDAQIPECPANGLLLLPDYDQATSVGSRLGYRAFTPEQLERLPALLRSAPFEALRVKGRHERALWLATQLGLPAKVRWELLVRSSWATADAAERRRLVERLAAEGPALIKEFEADAPGALGARVLVANALRELGRFDEARARIDAILASLDGRAGIDGPDDMRALVSMLGRMDEVIEARDDDRFPVGMASARWAREVCSGRPLPAPHGVMTKNARAACAALKR